MESLENCLQPRTSGAFWLAVSPFGVGGGAACAVCTAVIRRHANCIEIASGRAGTHHTMGYGRRKQHAGVRRQLPAICYCCASDQRNAPGAPQHMAYDLVLRGGRVIDPSQHLDAVAERRLRGGQGGARRPAARRRLRHRHPRRDGVHRRTGSDRPAHTRLLGRHLARHRCGGVLPYLGRDHRRRYRQRRSRQLRRLPQARDRAQCRAHPGVPAHLVRGHLRLLAPGAGGGERGVAPDGAARRRRGSQCQPRCHRRHQGAGRAPCLRHLGHRAPGNGAGSGKRDRPAADGAHRPSAADLRGGRRRASGPATS